MSAGEQFKPSNSSQGHAFIEGWCAKCARDKPMSEGKDYDACEPHEVCEILAASFRGEAKEWQYGPDGQPLCTMFVAAGQAIPVRCEHTKDMFG